MTPLEIEVVCVLLTFIALFIWDERHRRRERKAGR